MPESKFELPQDIIDDLTAVIVEVSEGGDVVWGPADRVWDFLHSCVTPAPSPPWEPDDAQLKIFKKHVWGYGSELLFGSLHRLHDAGWDLVKRDTL